MTIKTVWIVLVTRFTDGSAYTHVFGAYTTKALAEKRIKNHRDIGLINPGDAVYCYEEQVFSKADFL